MSKLYPPTLQEKIPAFYDNNLQIPLIMHPMVAYDEIKGFNILIKNVNTNTILCDQKVISGVINSDNLVLKVKLLNINNFQIGQYYKIQVAYIGIDGVGYYSSIGIVKFTAKPKVYIDGLNNVSLNNSLLQYNGIYSNVDQSEKVYSYEFQLYKDDVLIESSGQQIHDNSRNYNDLATDSYDSYIFKTDINTDLYKYKVKYQVITANNLIVESPLYNITQNTAISPESLKDFNMFGEVDKENGVIYIKLTSIQEKKILSGKFVLCRKNITKNTGWYKLVKLNISRSFNNEIIYTDYLIEQGNIYKYSLQQFTDDNLLIDKLETEEIYADFFHMFLYDGEKQLKIEYNPKVSSFKTDLQVSKIDTIGNQFPIFFKGGNMNYKEFPISGLISYHTDNEKFFYPYMEQPLNKTDDIFSSFDLIDVNFYSERAFKLSVLDFLNNGKPKIFKSPAEGTYIVMLINSSLSPEDKLSRMIHTFSCTAYEYENFSYEGLVATGFINIDLAPYTLDINTLIDDPDPAGEDLNENDYYKFITILLGHDLDHTLEDNNIVEDIPSYKDKSINQYIWYLDQISDDYVKQRTSKNDVLIKHKLNENILPNLCSYIKCENMLPGTIIMINDELYTIGPTGYLVISYDDFIIYNLSIIKYGVPALEQQDYLFGQITCRIFDEDKFNDLFNQKIATDIISSNVVNQYFDLRMLQEEFNRIESVENNDLISIINKRNNLISNFYITKTQQRKQRVRIISNNLMTYATLYGVMSTEDIPWIQLINQQGELYYKQELYQINYLRLKGKDIIPVYVDNNLQDEDGNDFDLNDTTILQDIIFFTDNQFEHPIGDWEALDPTKTYLIIRTFKQITSTSPKAEQIIFDKFGFLSPDCLKNYPFFSKVYAPQVEIKYKNDTLPNETFLLQNQSISLSDKNVLNAMKSIAELSENQMEIIIVYQYVNHRTKEDYNKILKNINANIDKLIENYNNKNDGSEEEKEDLILALMQIDFLKQKYLELVSIAQNDLQ